MTRVKDLRRIKALNGKKTHGNPREISNLCGLFFFYFFSFLSAWLLDLHGSLQLGSTIVWNCSSHCCVVGEDLARNPQLQHFLKPLGLFLSLNTVKKNQPKAHL